MSGTEGDKATRAAWWQVLPKPPGSACIPQHLPMGQAGGDAPLRGFPAALLQLFQSCPQGRGMPVQDGTEQTLRSGGAGLAPRLARSAVTLWGTSAMP